MTYFYFMKKIIIRLNDLSDLEKINPESFEAIPGYFYFPLNKILAVSKDGIVLNTKTLNIRKPTFNKDNGKLSIVISIGGKIYSYYLHRIIAITFIGRPSRHLDKNYNALEVNHINGNTTDNDISNLEWVTAQENLIHSHLSGFNPKDRPIQAFNFLTKELKTFNSLKSCSDYFNIHRATFHKCIKVKGFQFKCKSNIFRFYSDVEWKIPNISFDSLFELGSDRNLYLNIYVKDKINNKIYIFDSIVKTSNLTKISKVKLWRYLTKNKPLECEKYFITSDANLMRK